MRPLILKQALYKSVDPLVNAQKKIRDACLWALWHELITFPKPGLVSLEDSGSHSDMSASHFSSSIFALRFYFFQIAEAGFRGLKFEVLRELGISGEQRMLAATSGRNTHRGAIFNLGLLAAAAGYQLKNNIQLKSLGEIVTELWGEELIKHQRSSDSNGFKIFKKHGTGGALSEAQSGFRTVYQIGLPAYQKLLFQTQDPELARIHTFFKLLSVTEDTNLLYRGGLDGLLFARNEALSFLREGGVLNPGWHQHAVAIHHKFIARKLSPGGCADLLGACLLINYLDLTLDV